MLEDEAICDMPSAVTGIAGKQRQARQRLFVGRDREIRQFREVLERADLPRIFFVHGPGGIGKSTVLQSYAHLAASFGASFDPLDARHLPPIPAIVGRTVEVLLSQAAEQSIRIIAIDHYERIAALDGWLREQLIPGLPGNTLLILVGRGRPAPAWFADPGLSELLIEQELSSLSSHSAAEYLERREIVPACSARILAFARGYPLALALSSDLALRSPVPAFDPACPDLICALVEWLLADLDDPQYLLALQACASFRIVNVPLLTAMLECPAEKMFDWLSRQHFIERQAEGLVLHDLVRDVVLRHLRGRDLARHHRFIQRAADYLLDGLVGASWDEAQQAIAAIIHALRYEPHMQQHFPFDDHCYYPDAAQPQEVSSLAAEVERLEGIEASGWFKHWMDRQPEGLIVMRDSERNPVGAILSLQFGEAETAAGSPDPVVDGYLRYLRKYAPLREHEQGLLMRFMFAHGTHQQRTPVWAHVAVVSNTAMFKPGIVFASFVAELSHDWSGISENADANFLAGTEYTAGKRRFSLIGHDARREPAVAWARNCTARILHRGPDAQLHPPAVVILGKEDFATAVLDALKHFSNPRRLRDNALLSSGMLRRHIGHCHPGVEDLRGLIEQACSELLDDKPGLSMRRVLESACLAGHSKKLSAAGELHTSERTYRRRLRAAERSLVEMLWEYETTFGG